MNGMSPRHLLHSPPSAACFRLPGVFLLSLALVLGGGLYAQDAAPRTAPPGTDSAGDAGAEWASAAEVPGEEGFPEEKPEEEEPELSPEQRMLSRDINTSTLTELAEWCRNLGLSEGGNREELTRRLKEYFEFPPESLAGKPPEKGPKIIIIESARTTEYFTLDSVDEEYARLSGDVVVSMVDGDRTHLVKAREILYNRTRNIMTATGNVEYITTQGDTTETFKGESITVNIDNWSSLFLDGSTEKTVSNSDTSYRFTGTIMSRSDEKVTKLSDAEISNAKSEDKFWSMKASRLWLLPGSDWTVLNAVLKVGNVPVFYFPAFHYPADEIIFHPVLGTRSREGTLVQTTTYILGRPKAADSTENSVSTIMGSGSNMEKKREGLFLRSTGRKTRDPNDTRLAFILDGYTNLGAYMGTELALPQKGILGATTFSLGFGLTRNVYLNNSSNTPFADYTTGESDWNSSNFFSVNVPFRYRMNTVSSLSGKYGSLNLNFPYYADPFVNEDFLDRSEDSDLLNTMYRLMHLNDATETIDPEKNKLSSYEWRLAGTLTPDVNMFAPYLTSFSITNASSTIGFRTRARTAWPEDSEEPRASNAGLQKSTHDPSREFFFPDKFTMFSLSASAGGSVFTWGDASSSNTSAGAAKTEDEEGKPKLLFDPLPPWPKEKESENPDDPFRLNPPVLSNQFTLPPWIGPRISLDYTLTPSMASELQFRTDSANWPTAEDIDWSEISSILTTLRNDGTLGLNLRHAEGNAYSASFILGSSSSWQDYNYINEEAEEYTTKDANGQTVLDEAKVKSARDRAKANTSFSSTWETTFSLKPFFRNLIWGNSGLQYTLKGLLAKTLYDTTLTEPAWRWEYGEWTKDRIDIHQFSANADASVMDHTQSLIFTVDIPPRYISYGWDATARIWISETNFKAKYLENPNYNEDAGAEITAETTSSETDDSKKKWKWDPLYLTETLRFGKTGSFQEYVVFDPELNEYTTVNSTFGIGGFTMALNAARSRGYELKEDQGWVETDEEEALRFQEFRLGYSNVFSKEKLWKDRLSFSVNIDTTLSFDLLRYTNSRFSFTLGFTAKITNFLELTFSANSENAVVYRYVQDIPFLKTSVTLPGEKNPIIDLFNSFRFDSTELRTASGFKLKSFRFDMVHHLGDWDATLGLTLSPYLDKPAGEIPKYKFNTEVSFLVKWIPISEIKSEIKRYRDSSTSEDRITIK